MKEREYERDERARVEKKNLRNKGKRENTNGTGIQRVACIRVPGVLDLRNRPSKLQVTPD